MMRATSFAVTLAFVLGAGPAAADGLLVSREALPPETREWLERSVAEARGDHPDWFAYFDRSSEPAPASQPGPAVSRSGQPIYFPPLSPRNTEFFYPILSEIALDGSPRVSSQDPTGLAWKVSLLEALGSLHDERSKEVLKAVLDGPETEFSIVRAAAAALGRLRTDDVVEWMVERSRRSGEKQLGILAGMGFCHRAASALRLGEALLATSSDREAVVLAEALGTVGSAWAWKTRSISASGEEETTRSTAARTLVKGFVAFEAPLTRIRIQQALLVVDWPETPTIIAESKTGAEPETVAALDELQSAFESSPFHRPRGSRPPSSEP